MGHIFKVGDGQSFKVKLNFYPLFGITSKRVQPANYKLPNGDLIWSGVIDGKTGVDGWKNSLSSCQNIITMENSDPLLFSNAMTACQESGADTALWVIFMKSSRSSDYTFLGTFRYAKDSPPDGKLLLERVGDEYTA